MNTQSLLPRKERRRKQPPVLSLTGLHYFTEKQKQLFTSLCERGEDAWSEEEAEKYNELVTLSSQLDKAYWGGHFSRHAITH